MRVIANMNYVYFCFVFVFEIKYNICHIFFIPINANLSNVKPATHDATSWMRLFVCGFGSKKLVVTLVDTRHDIWL